MKSLSFIICLGMLFGIAPAQTTGVPGANDFVVNGTGSGASSCVTTTVFSTLDFQLSAAPGSILLGAFSQGCGPSAPIGAATGTFDLSGAGLGFWIDGTNSVGAGNPLNQFAVADGAGNWSFSASVPALPNSLSLGAYQFAVIGAAYGPSGFDVTQAHALTTPLFSCPILANTVTLGDDQSAQATFTAGSFGFYGAMYSDVFIASNGSLSFGAEDNDFSPSAAEFLANGPRISPMWCDLNPGGGGTISFSEAAGVFSASWVNVPSLAGGNDNNSFCCDLDLATGNITTTIARADLNGNTLNVLTGISPGGALSTALSVDISAGLPILAVGANEAIFEEFLTGVTAFDLESTVLNWAPSSPGTGPYTVF